MGFDVLWACVRACMRVLWACVRACVHAGMLFVVFCVCVCVGGTHAFRYNGPRDVGVRKRYCLLTMQACGRFAPPVLTPCARRPSPRPNPSSRPCCANERGSGVREGVLPGHRLQRDLRPARGQLQPPGLRHGRCVSGSVVHGVGGGVGPMLGCWVRQSAVEGGRGGWWGGQGGCSAVCMLGQQQLMAAADVAMRQVGVLCAACTARLEPP